jgi:hypothetical protein
LPFCPNCGTQVDQNLLYCPNCGKMLLPPAGQTGMQNTISVSLLPEEKIALSNIQWFALLSIANSLIGFASYALFLPGEMSLIGTQSTSNITTVFQSVVQNVIILGTVAAVLIAISYFFLLLGFRSLRSTANEFTTPSRLTIVALVSTSALLLALLALIASFVPILQSAVNGTPLSSISLANFGLFALVFFIFGIAGLVGFIGGVMLGIWRTGSRFDNSLLKAGAIFLIIPFLSIVGPILILVAIHQVRGKQSFARY